MTTIQMPHQQTGLALVELIIALALSAVLMLGVTRMFADSVSNSSSETALAQVQDSARIAMEVIKKDVRMAGFQGNAPSSVVPEANSLVDLSQQAVSIVADTTDATNSDTLRVQRAFETSKSMDLSDSNAGNGVVRVVNFYDTANGNQLQFDRAICYDSDDIFLITDGQKVATFKPQQAAACITTNPETSSNERVTPIGENDNGINLSVFAIPDDCSTATLEFCPILYQLGSANGSTYTVQDRLDSSNNPLTATDGNTIPALFVNGDEMVEGVENLQFLLGITDSSGNTKYAESCSAAEISSGDCNITHIKLSMVVSSSFPVSSQQNNQSYPILNMQAAQSTFQPNDRRLRRVFTSTIQLRNRG
ncbi:PilW family protein [Endozoicomonas sp. ONNA1]|uniref:PilW family protein n=1 Tax=Endozoicomonas sp. ONNA1 TaxID=2828740 RepID=UPI0021473C10|nr:PilW family protein [Endozoicomonas sp. ONNA1]